MGVVADVEIDVNDDLAVAFVLTACVKAGLPVAKAPTSLVLATAAALIGSIDRSTPRMNETRRNEGDTNVTTTAAIESDCRARLGRESCRSFF